MRMRRAKVSRRSALGGVALMSPAGLKEKLQARLNFRALPSTWIPMAFSDGWKHPDPTMQHPEGNDHQPASGRTCRAQILTSALPKKVRMCRPTHAAAQSNVQRSSAHGSLLSGTSPLLPGRSIDAGKLEVHPTRWADRCLDFVRQLDCRGFMTTPRWIVIMSSANFRTKSGHFA